MQIARFLTTGFATSALAFLAASFDAGCTTKEAVPPGERVGKTTQPIFGGIPDTWRGYVVGVGDKNGAFCTGTVVGKRSVLTAGHCFGGITRVFFGNDVNQPTATLTVSKSVRHPLWNGNTLAHDLTMVKLSSDSPVQPAPLLRETMDNSATYVGPDFTYVGYGIDEKNNFGVRRVATFPIKHVGQGQVGGSVGSIDDTQYYYAVKGKNTCNGDSGGPAFLPRGRVEHITGTTSFGDQNCVIDGVNARADLPDLTAFIQVQIDAFENSDPCRSDGVCNEACNVGPDLVDPDCADNHCAADGICALSCVAPVDPDCTGNNYCGLDGACDPSCANPVDPDCAIFCGPDGICQATGCAQPDPDCNPACAVNGAACDDNDACTQTDTCNAGQCVGGNPVVCVPIDDCHDAACDPANGMCSQSALPDGTPCVNGLCMGGTCTMVMAQSSAVASSSSSASSTNVTSTGTSMTVTVSSSASSGTGGSGGTIAVSSSASVSSSATTTATGVGGGVSERSADGSDSGGCSCSVPETERRSQPAPIALALLGAALVIRRRR